MQHMEWAADSDRLLCAMYKKGVVEVGGLGGLSGWVGGHYAPPFPFSPKRLPPHYASRPAGRGANQSASQPASQRDSHSPSFPTSQALRVSDPSWGCAVSEGTAGIAAAYWAPDGRSLLTLTDFGLSLTVWAVGVAGADPTQTLVIRKPKPEVAPAFRYACTVKRCTIQQRFRSLIFFALCCPAHGCYSVDGRRQCWSILISTPDCTYTHDDDDAQPRRLGDGSGLAGRLQGPHLPLQHRWVNILMCMCVYDDGSSPFFYLSDDVFHPFNTSIMAQVTAPASGGRSVPSPSTPWTWQPCIGRPTAPASLPRWVSQRLWPDK